MDMQKEIAEIKERVAAVEKAAKKRPDVGSVVILSDSSYWAAPCRGQVGIVVKEEEGSTIWMPEFQDYQHCSRGMLHNVTVLGRVPGAVVEALQ